MRARGSEVQGASVELLKAFGEALNTDHGLVPRPASEAESGPVLNAALAKNPTAKATHSKPKAKSAAYPASFLKSPGDDGARAKPAPTAKAPPAARDFEP